MRWRADTQCEPHVLRWAFVAVLGRRANGGEDSYVATHALECYGCEQLRVVGVGCAVGKGSHDMGHNDCAPWLARTLPQACRASGGCVVAWCSKGPCSKAPVCSCGLPLVCLRPCNLQA